MADGLGKHGGPRPNSGRPKGSTSLITSAQLRAKFMELTDGVSLEEAVVRSYLDFMQEAQVEESPEGRGVARANALKVLQLLAKYCFQPAPQRIETEDSDTASRDELLDRLKALESR